MKLCTKYQRPRPPGIRLEDFFKVFSISLCETCRPKGRAILGLRAITKNLGRGPLGEFLIVLGFNDTSTLMGHFVSSPREREKRDRRDSRRDERD